MKSKTAWALLLAFSTATNAAAAAPGSAYLRGSVGFATQSLEELNDDVRRVRSDLSELSTRLDWENLGHAVPFGIEAGYQVSERVSWGIGFTYQSSEVERYAAVDFGSTGGLISGDFGEAQDLSVLDLYGTFTVWAPASGLHVGGQIGVARGTLDFSDFVDLTASDGSFVVGDGRGEADATALSAGIYAGYEAALSPSFGLSGRIGYLYCNLGEMEGDYTFIGDDETGPIDSSGTGPVTDSAGRPVDFDVSGLRASAAVTIRFGGPGGY